MTAAKTSRVAKIDPKELTEFMKSHGVTEFKYGDLEVKFHPQAVELPEKVMSGEQLKDVALKAMKKMQEQQILDEEWSV